MSNIISNHIIDDETVDQDDTTEAKLITLECRPKNIAIGVFYGPQENAKIDTTKAIYNKLETQINQKAGKNEIILGGDFNAKLEINHKDGNQQESRNGRILQEIITRNNLTAASTKADLGLWTRVNRRKTSEKSVIDYILTSTNIKNNITSMIIDEEGSLRITGKNQTDHNTLLMNMKINNPRKPTYRETWKLNNREGWKEFNQEMKKKKPSVETQYNEIESKILDTMEKTVGKVKIRTDKEKKILSEKAKQTKKTKKEAKETFQEACKKGDPTEKAKAKENYIRAQMEYRKEIEETEREQIERRIKKLTEKAKIDPNTIWKTRKRTNRPNEIEYNTITEEGETITDPRKAKEYIANYFENLYQARPGTEDYQEWTEHIADTIKNRCRK